VPRPGVDVAVVDEVIGEQPILDTGQAFFVGKTERGPLWGRASSMAEYKSKWGLRTGGPEMYDAVGPFFDEGGGAAIISKLQGAAGVAASGAMAGMWTAKAVSPGTWGNNVKVITRQPATGSTGAAGQPIYLEVQYNNVIVELSPTLYDADDGTDWATRYSNYIILPVGAGPFVLPIKDTTYTLAGGTDVAAAVGDYDAALARFTYEQGPGQVQAPAATDPLIHQKVGLHCENAHRVGLVDLPDTANKATLHAARDSLNQKPGARLLLACGSWYSYPTDASPATKVVPMSGVQSGIVARVDRGGDAAAVAAGSNGISRRALGLSQAYSDADRQELNANGVTLGRQMYGLVRTYGYRTAAGPDYRDNWTFWQESRVIMAIAHEGNAAVEEYVFDTIDGFGHIFVDVKNVLAGICLRYWRDGALYGPTPERAFRIVCDETNNPIDTIRLGEIHAAIYVKTSKIAEWVKIDIVKVPIEREVTA
jgi:Bacteriophage tail sheath protein